jgi:vesicle coat complex subunit
MAHTKFASMLAGGDRRSIGRANLAVSMILSQPHRFPELFACLRDSDALVRMRAADALEKMSRQRPDMFEDYKTELLDLLAEAKQQELRWHLALIVPRLPLKNSEQKRAVACLHQYLNDSSSIVKTCALQGLSDLARVDPRLRRSVRKLLEACARTGTAAMRARARKLLSHNV